MKSRIAFVGGFVGGYVLGSRAGRARYEELKRRSQDFIESPLVQEKAAQVKDFAAEKAPVVGHKVSDAAAKATQSVKDTVSRDDSEDKEQDAGQDGQGEVAPAGVAAAPALVLTDNEVAREEGAR